MRTSRLGWLVILASWTSSCCAAALRAPPLTALPRIHHRPARALPPLALSSAEPSFNKRKLDREFFAIAAPAFIQFAAEPLARLVDAYYMGRLGAVALGGAGAAIAAQYAVAKLCNDPLLRSTISLVAAGDGAQAADDPAEATVRAEPVATALLLALIVGVMQVRHAGAQHEAALAPALPRPAWARSVLTVSEPLPGSALRLRNGLDALRHARRPDLADAR